MKSGVFLSGISDEAARDFERQLQAHVQLGWRHIDLRSVEGVPVAQISPATMRRYASAVDRCGLQVSCLCSQLGNWGRTLDYPLDAELDELRALCRHAQLLRARFIRVMSYAGRTPRGGADDEDVVARLGAFAAIAGDHGIVLLHENCTGHFAGGWQRSLELIKAVGSEHLRLLFDIGNGLAYGYDSVEFLARTLGCTSHVHLKDGVRTKTALEGGAEAYDVDYCFPGLGEARVSDCLRLLIEAGYRGGISIEPHLSLIPHLQQDLRVEDGGAYVEYGRAAQTLLESLGGEFS